MGVRHAIPTADKLSTFSSCPCLQCGAVLNVWCVLVRVPVLQQGWVEGGRGLGVGDFDAALIALISSLGLDVLICKNQGIE